jgi:transposase
LDFFSATWRSGYAAACKAVYTGSIPVVASNEKYLQNGTFWALSRLPKNAEKGHEIAWAIEDCRHVSQRFERSLVSAGERVLRVAPKLMGASRRGEREPGKSDQIDARAIARAVLRDGIEPFPAAFLDEQAIEIRLLCDHREILVGERTRLINRLRWNLVILTQSLRPRSPRASSTTLANSSASPAASERCRKLLGFVSPESRSNASAADP